MIDVRSAQARAHPTRVRILAAFDEVGAGAVASPVELARQIRLPVGSVAYHVRRLVDFGVVEFVYSVPRRGALEHYYRVVEQGPTKAEAEAWAGSPEGRAMLRALLG